MHHKSEQLNIELSSYELEKLGVQVSFVNTWDENRREKIKMDSYLVAAAPELLAACEMIDSLDPHNDSTTEWNGAFKMVRAAIAKAKGYSS